VTAGVFANVFEQCLRHYDACRGIDWHWCSLDSAMVTQPKGGDHTGPNPTDRAKKGVKRHVLTDARTRAGCACRRADHRGERTSVACNPQRARVTF
jgi:hypothetical protein